MLLAYSECSILWASILPRFYYSLRCEAGSFVGALDVLFLVRVHLDFPSFLLSANLLYCVAPTGNRKLWPLVAEKFKVVCLWVLAFYLISSGASFFSWMVIIVVLSSNFSLNFFPLVSYSSICSCICLINCWQRTIKSVFCENLVMLVRIQLLLLARLGHGGCR